MYDEPQWSSYVDLQQSLFDLDFFFVPILIWNKCNYRSQIKKSSLELEGAHQDIKFNSLLLKGLSKTKHCDLSMLSRWSLNSDQLGAMTQSVPAVWLPNSTKILVFRFYTACNFIL